MNSDEAGAFLFGAIAAVILTLVGLAIGSTNMTTHDIGWGQYVCFTTTDREEAGSNVGHQTVLTKTTHCIPTEEVAKWAKEHNR